MKRETNVNAPLKRLLRLIELAGGEVPIKRGDAATFTIARSGRVHSFPEQLLATSRSEDLVEIHNDRVVLTEVGVAHLRRLQFPDTAHLSQQAALVTATIATETGNQAVTVHTGESPLARLRHRPSRNGRPFLSATQYAAGERLRSDFERGQLQPKVSAPWDRPLAGGGRQMAGDISDFALDARRKVEGALDSLEGELAGVALDICCFLKGVEQVERERGWPPRSAKLMLRTALSLLGRHYGLEGRAPGRGRTTLHWGETDYRPSL